jgi:hypothetical protein
LTLHELNKEAPGNHNLIAGVQTRIDVVSVPGAKTDRDVAPREAAVGLRDVDEWQVFIVSQDGGNRDQESGVFLPRLDQDAHIHLLLQ